MGGAAAEARGATIRTLRADDEAGRETGLGAELDRIAVLVRALQRHREGKPGGAELKASLAEAQARVTQARAAGFWQGLIPPELDGPLRPLAHDLVAACLYPALRPSAVATLTGLQGQASEGAVTQAFIHELLLATPAEEALLHGLLSPASPLRATGLVRIEGEGPLRRVLPGPELMRRVRPGDSFAELPPGMRLVRHQTTVTGAVFSERTRAQIDEVVALAAYQAEREARGERNGPGGPAVLFVGGPAPARHWRRARSPRASASRCSSSISGRLSANGLARPRRTSAVSSSG